MLLDSNIIIYSAQPEFAELREFIRNNKPGVCWINYLEVLGYNKLSDKDILFFEDFFSASIIYEINFEIIQLATSLRRKKMMKLGDSLVAAIAIYFELTLITHNTEDFKHIRQLQLIDPLAK
ncbi:MAG: type II toxin-antitoxin system VapC family toxin [Bacteroidia bacterium]